VLAHGFGAVRTGRLLAYAERFAAAGAAAVVFDYRHWGDSDGEPRRLLDIGRQLADWASAVTFARALDGVDPGRIALWGTSFSGGHVLEVASRDPRVAAVIAQVPHVDGLATMRAAGPVANVRQGIAGVRDALGARLGRAPYEVPIVGPPGSTAAMTSPDAAAGYAALYDDAAAWENRVAARVLLEVGLYSPGRHADRIACPVLVQVAEDDAVTPAAGARSVARRALRGELREYPGGHFDIYRGVLFERAVSDQVAFLRRVLGLEEDDALVA
jgi:uncharacterized protein